MSGIGKSRETESRLVVFRAWEPEFTEKSQGKLGWTVVTAAEPTKLLKPLNCTLTMGDFPGL